MKIKQGDTVLVKSGKSAGTSGKVMESIPKKGKIIIEGVNIVKRHRKATSQRKESGIIEKPAPIDVSNVMLMCPKCKMPTRVGYSVVDGTKKRMCKKCHKSFD